MLNHRTGEHREHLSDPLAQRLQDLADEVYRLDPGTRLQLGLVVLDVLDRLEGGHHEVGP